MYNKELKGKPPKTLFINIILHIMRYILLNKVLFYEYFAVSLQPICKKHFLAQT